MKDISILDVVTASIAFAGFILGVFNTITEIFRRRPRLRLSVRWAYLDFGGGFLCWGLALKIVNRGEVPLCVNQVCYEYTGGFVAVNSVPIEGWGEKDRIEPGNSCVVRIPRETFRNAAVEEVGRLFIELASEKKFYARSIRREVAALKADAENQFKEAAMTPRRTFLAPENSTEEQKRQIEKSAGYYDN